MITGRATTTTIFYPETDGLPLPDGRYQYPIQSSVVMTLRTFFHEMPRVEVNGNTFIYYAEGNPRLNFAPDCHVTMGLTEEAMESLDRILVAAPDGAQIPLGQLARIHYVRGPQVIKSEDTFLVGYVLFDKKPGYAEVDVVEACRAELEARISSGELEIPAGVSYVFAGSYENQLRAQERLRVVLPLALLTIFLILYFQFKNVPATLLVFSGILLAWAGGFIMIWLYGQGWFLDFSVFGTSMRALFQVEPINLSVAVWVGFLALFGIASDNGVITATYLRRTFARQQPATREAMRRAALEAGVHRARPCLMTVATTILALLPVLTASGRGADIMVPMAIPTFGGMIFAVVTMQVVPVLYCAVEEQKLRWRQSRREPQEA